MALVLACRSGPPTVVVVGGGLAGMAAAIEVAPAGRVILLAADADQLGGNARWGQGLVAVPPVAQWSGDDPARVRYRERVTPDVLQWTEAMGLQWVPFPETAGVSLRGLVGGERRLIAALTQQVQRAGVEVRLGEEVTDISADLRVTTADGDRWRADAVILATDGWAADLPSVRDRLGMDAGVRLLNGAARSDSGVGEALAVALGAQPHAPAQAILYGHGTPDPNARDHALMVTGIQRVYYMDHTGEPQPGLATRDASSGQRLLQLPDQAAWAIMDATRGSHMLQGFRSDRAMGIARVAEQSGHVAPDLETLAEKIDVPVQQLRRGVAVDKATDERPLLWDGPYYALPVYPTTVQSISGVETDASGRVLDRAGEPIPRLYAAGAVMGFGHPYDEGVLDHTMLAGAILTGRIAGRAVLADVTSKPK